jgi:NTP pyrophosphatase (non-canonical NTP hydrolase)
LRTFDWYELAALRTRSEKAVLGEQALINAALGLTGEAGEFADLVKKVVFHDHPLDNATRQKMVKELGDILWYLPLACYALGVPLDTVAAENIEKLRQRYPEGFDSQRSINKTDG